MKTPFFSITSKIVLAIALIVTGYFGAQAMRANLEARPRQMSAIDEADIALKVEANKPRFVGDVGGIFIAPEGTPVPEQYATYESLCGEQFGKSVPWNRAGELDFDITLPEGYVLQTNDINTDVVACGDTVFVARRVYNVPSGGQAIIGRTLLTYSDTSVAVDRPQARHINGRDVVVVEPLTNSGLFQNAHALFPEPFGITFIDAIDMSSSEFNKLVAYVASSTR